ncbi:MAG: amidohydrolase family protein [Ktedonobacteraceae bacterium]|nr:amidohydrolase family protein [Ktedonobacteraceae bacterium]
MLWREDMGWRNWFLFSRQALWNTFFPQLTTYGNRSAYGEPQTRRSSRLTKSWEIEANDEVKLVAQSVGYPKRRGITRVKELLAGGVNVSLGHDSIMDPWFPLGRGDMLAAAQLALFLCHMSGYDEIQDVLDLITTNAARTLRIQDRYGIEEGKPADFLILDAPNAFEALRLVSPRLHIFKAGREIASTTPTQSLLRRSGDDQGQPISYRTAQ